MDALGSQSMQAVRLLSFVPLITLCTSRCCDNSNIVHITNSQLADLDDHCAHYCAQWQSAFARSHLFQSSQGDLDFQHHAQLHTILVIVQHNSIYIVEQQPTLYLKKSGLLFSRQSHLSEFSMYHGEGWSQPPCAQMYQGCVP